MPRTLSRETISTQQRKIAALARHTPTRVLTTLAHHIDVGWLQEASRRTRKRSAAGGGRGLTAAQYETALEANRTSVLERFQSGRYRAPAVRRVHIPKAGVGKQTRPIGIPTLEDKVLQRAVVMALEPMYEQDCLDCSYGFRPGRGAHQALERVWRGLMDIGGGWVVDLDIQHFFDSVDRAQLGRVLDQRVRDGVIRRAIGKWLRAGVMEDGRVWYPDQGTPQGGVVTPRTQKVTSLVSTVIGAAQWRAAPRRRSRGDGDRVSDHDRVVVDEHFFHDETDDTLSLKDVQRIGRLVQPREKGRERLCQAQIRRAISGLVGDRLQLRAQRLLALAQPRHPLPQLLKRHEILLIGGEQPLDALANAYQIQLHRLLACLRRVGRASGGKPPIKLLLNQQGILEQPHDLGPHDLIQQVLPHGVAIAPATAQVPPRI